MFSAVTDRLAVVRSMTEMLPDGFGSHPTDVCAMTGPETERVPATCDDFRRGGIPPTPPFCTGRAPTEERRRGEELLDLVTTDVARRVLH